MRISMRIFFCLLHINWELVLLFFRTGGSRGGVQSFPCWSRGSKTSSLIQYLIITVITNFLDIFLKVNIALTGICTADSLWHNDNIHHNSNWWFLEGCVCKVFQLLLVLGFGVWICKYLICYFKCLFQIIISHFFSKLLFPFNPTELTTG